jgi:signal transduction histidine kinase
VTKIDKYNLNICKLYLDYGIQIRHVKNLPGMSFGVSDKEIALTIEKMKRGKKVQSLLISNEPLYIKHFSSLFEEIWSNGIDATYRIKQIEEGTDADIEVIQNPHRTKELYLNAIRSCKKEILLIFPTINSIIRQEKIGIIKSLSDAAVDRKVRIRILMPEVSLSHKHDTIEEFKRLHQQQGDPDSSINIRHLQQPSDTKATILIADRKLSLVMELRDDSKSSFYEAIGLSTYSSSKAGVLSYVSIFENLWIQTELYEQLKARDKMQEEFINIAAHELRTPIQPILGLTEIALSKTKDESQQKLLEIVVRNAKRLKRLVENILDITRIENQSLELHKEKLNINEIISTVLAEYEGQNKSNINTNRNSNVKIVFTHDNHDLFVEADKIRLMQVIFNLMDNAIKFTHEGTIKVMIKKEEVSNQIIISIKDTGSGIDPEIMPRLFSKFATKSQTGTGLGLFISQNIVEAHGGKIWADNNPDRKGSTFSFSVPLATT